MTDKNEISNVTPLRPKDRTNADRQRRYRARSKRNGGPQVDCNGRLPVALDGATSPSVTAVTVPLKNQAVATAARAAADAMARLATVASPVTVTLSDELPAVTEAQLAQLDDRRPAPAAIPPVEAPPPGPAAPSPPYPSPQAGEGRPRSGRVANVLVYAVAIGLAGCAAWFSLKGLAVLFPGAPIAIVVMGITMEAAKLVACGWLARAWRQVPWVFRGILMALILGLAVINAAGTFSQLTAAHVGDRAVTMASWTIRGVDLDQRIEVAAGKLADLDRRISAIDGIVSGAAQRGRAITAQAAMEDQRKARAGLVAERAQAAEALATLKVDRGGVAARAAIAESEAAPIMYAAEVIGIEGDPERAIRLLIALMVLCCDPLAIALTAAASTRRSTAA